MADHEHLKIIKQGVGKWNAWVEKNWIRADLSKANLEDVNLKGAKLMEANLRGATLERACLEGAYLMEADLRDANLKEAKLSGANLPRAKLANANLYRAELRYTNLYAATLNNVNLYNAYLFRADFGATNLIGANLSNAVLNEASLTGANLNNAILSKAYLNRADLSNADLSQADLSNADMSGANLVKANFGKANLTGCKVYGVSAWDLKLGDAIQTDLVITPDSESIITVDNMEIAQFIYLLLNNEKIRNVIDTITSKVVLILGRFTPERKSVLDAIRDALRKCNYLPVLFDFQKPDSRDFIETVSTLAHMARFVIADFTDPKIVLEEVPHIARNIAVPIQPLLEKGSGKEPVTLHNLRRNHKSLLETYWYSDSNHLIESLEKEVIASAEAKAKEFEK